MALRLCAGREIVIGSRDPAKAVARAAEYEARSGCSEIRGASNAEASELGDYVILAVPADTLPGLLDVISGRIKSDALLISPIVPMSRSSGYLVHDPSTLDPSVLSAAEYIAKRTGRRVAAAYHTLPAPLLAEMSARLNLGVPVASEKGDFEALRRDLSIDGVRYLHAGPLEVARYLESLVPLLLNIGRRNGIRNPSIKIVKPLDFTLPKSLVYLSQCRPLILTMLTM